MPKTPRMTALEAEQLLLRNGFVLLRAKGSHRIYIRGNTRVVLAYHSGQTLHPKIVRQIHKAIESL